MPFKNGSLRLFRLLGVNVYVHWSWALFAIFEIWRRSRPAEKELLPQHSVLFHTALYLCLFAIVLIHEFGHALACKSVGGRADRIVLWPLGGLAFVQPPPRPGAVLWSIAAGPLVNVVLLPLTWGPALLMGVPTQFGGAGTAMAGDFVWFLAIINLGLLLFNMLPLYPLDGGQIFRSLLWFICGPGLSLVIAAAVGLAGAGVLALLALVGGMPWLAVLVAFMGFQSVYALRAGWGMVQLQESPRRVEVRCPSCGVHPPVGKFWHCPCGAALDTFETHGQCPRCGRTFETTACAACGQSHPLASWYPLESAAPAAEPLVTPMPPARPGWR